MERGALTRTLTPPIISAVNHRIARRLGMIFRDEALYPRHHFGMAQTVAGGAVGVVFDVEHAGEGDTVAGPAAAVSEEEGRLGASCAGVRVGEVVTAADETGACCSVVMA